MIEVTLAGVGWVVNDVDGPGGGARILDLIQPSLVMPQMPLPPQLQQAVQAIAGSQPPIAVIHVPFDRLTAAQVGRHLIGQAASNGNGEEPKVVLPGETDE